MVEETPSEAELPLDRVGARLLRAREAAGLSRAQLAAITKIPERHLAAVEAGDFASLPAKTYALGFSRAYARAVGLDEAETIASVRSELAAQAPVSRRMVQSFEPGDPARLPSARFAWLSLAGAVVLILAGFALWRSYYVPGATLPSILPDEAPAASAPAPTPPRAGEVVFTATEPGVWVKFSNGAGVQLLEKELAQGESYTVPDLPDVVISTSRPQALAITVGGQPVARLADEQRSLTDVPVTAAALLARGGASRASDPVQQPAARVTVQRDRPRTAPRRDPVPATTPAPAPVATSSAAAVPPPTTAADR